MSEVLGDRELAAVTEVFKMFETWPLAGRMAADRLLPAMNTLGLSPAEWEIVELHSEYGANGFISLPDFVAIFTEKMNSSFESDDFTLKAIFRAIKGTEPYNPTKTAPIRSYDNYELSFQVRCLVLNYLPQSYHPVNGLPAILCRNIFKRFVAKR